MKRFDHAFYQDGGNIWASGSPIVKSETSPPGQNHIVVASMTVTSSNLACHHPAPHMLPMLLCPHEPRRLQVSITFTSLELAVSDMPKNPDIQILLDPRHHLDVIHHN